MSQSPTNSEAVEAMNEAYRAGDAPSELAQKALATVVTTGSLSDDMQTALVDELWECVPEGKRGPYEGGIDNGLASAFSRDDTGITVYVSDLLFNQQPLGVILGDLHDHVRKRGSAIITDVAPRSDSVNEMMDMHHIAITIEPLPIWLNRYFDPDSGFTQI